VDRVDMELIGLLQKNARMPLNQLAGHVYLSSPAASARIQRLEREGIIKGYEAQLDLIRLNFPIVAFISLEMTPKQKPVVYPFISACPNVMECSCVTGQYSMLIKVAHRSTQELDAFIGQLQRFGNTMTQIVFSTAVEHRGINLMALSDPDRKEVELRQPGQDE